MIEQLRALFEEVLSDYESSQRFIADDYSTTTEREAQAIQELEIEIAEYRRRFEAIVKEARRG